MPDPIRSPTIAIRGPSIWWRRKIDRIDFVVAGVQKAGTTALHSFIAKHPHIALPRDQADHFFDDEENFSGEPDYNEMLSHFAPGRRWRIAGEVTSDYTYWKPAMERIARYNPKMKIIISLRNPADRAFSHWNMRRAKSQEPDDFLDALKRDRAQPIEDFSLNARRFAYVDRGLYSGQIERVFRFFPRDQVLIIKYENFRKDYSGTVDSVFDFIGVRRLRGLKNRERNVGPYQRKMTPEEREYASAIFQEDITKLEALLNWDCSDWRT
ncbi:MAG: sulfotransferase domain-containing protein [Verrucomicrobiota bacterium]